MKQRLSTVDNEEIARFSALADSWWDPHGPMRPLHALNPTRLAHIKDEIVRHAGRDRNDTEALTGLAILDVGCGAGLITEPLRRLGADVTGIDPSAENIAAARVHADGAGLTIDYRVTTAEALAMPGAFDVVLALEVVEHVADLHAFVAACARLIGPGGLFIGSTINRTFKAFALAIVGAEYVLGWLPRGTHSYAKLVTPAELAAALRAAGLSPRAPTGVTYRPLEDRWRLTDDTDVNYFISATRA